MVFDSFLPKRESVFFPLFATDVLNSLNLGSYFSLSLASFYRSSIESRSLLIGFNFFGADAFFSSLSLRRTSLSSGEFLKRLLEFFSGIAYPSILALSVPF